MLSTIYIKNFAIIDSKTIPFTKGFNVLSGETGTGKSILIDALGLQLGNRADSSWIRHGETRCDIQSDYILPTNSPIYDWLCKNEFNDENSCQLRRTLSDSGKSTCYINAIPTTVGNSKILGKMLVDIHGQHAHQSLAEPEKQLLLLDNFAENSQQRKDVKKAYHSWQNLLKQRDKLQQGDTNLTNQYDLLCYQLAELNATPISKNEFDDLSATQKRLSAVADILQYTQNIQSVLSDGDGISDKLGHLISTSAKVTQLDPCFNEVNELLNQALICIDEAISSLNSYASTLEIDPQSLAVVENRMSHLHELARKHHIEPDELTELQNQLNIKLENVNDAVEQLKTLDQDITTAEKTYQSIAKNLSKNRIKAAEQLSNMIHIQLEKLNLENAHFRIDFTSITAKANGIDKIIFMFAPNPGQGEKPLHKIASGGELSRISLAIQVASVAQKSDTTLIFDEVDSGVGGATAEVIGRLLKTLSQYNQIICVTHLAQVAAFADHHIKISKQVNNGKTFTDFHPLQDDNKVEELARMSGGIKRDKKTKEHAQNLLDNAVQFSHSLLTKTD
ncbi:MAG: DNA repair protein RecN [Ostreibacterium sp.]